MALSLLAAVCIYGSGPARVHSEPIKVHAARGGYWTFDYSCPKFMSHEAVPDLANQKLYGFCEGTLKQWKTSDTKGMDKPTTAWEAEITPTIFRSTLSLISVDFTFYSDAGGAHPNQVHTEFNFGMVGGKAKKLGLEDLARPGKTLLPTVSKYVIGVLRKKQASWIIDGQIKALDKNSANEFVIKSDRLIYIFSAYEMGSYAEGPYQVEVPFSFLKGKLDPKGPLKGLL